jgi:pimeloyl-ACP methyl ester carboxylesterase
MKNNSIPLLLFSCLIIVNATWAYPPAYEASLEATHDAGMSVWYFIPEDIQQAFIDQSQQGYFGLGGSMNVVDKDEDTAIISMWNVYSDTLYYKMVKISPDSDTDFDELVVGEQKTRIGLMIDSVENTGVDLSKYGDKDGLWLDSLMSSPEYEIFGQRLYARARLGRRTDTTMVMLDLHKYTSIYHYGNPWQNSNPPPTIRNCRYGPNWGSQVFDFWRANSEEPAPVYMFIHGGGWNANEKYRIFWAPRNWRNKYDVSFATVAVNYRLNGGAKNDGLNPPAMGPLYDAARAMQAVRSMASKLNIDPDRIATGGGSAGGCSSMWLSLHDDIADPSSNDPIARYSSKPTVGTALNGQTSLNPYDFEEWPYIGTTNAIYDAGMPPSAMGADASGRDGWQAVKEALYAVPREHLEEYSPITHVSADDVPVYLEYTTGLVNCTTDSCDGGAIHHAQMGVALKDKLDPLGVECVLDIPGTSYEDPYGSTTQFIIDKLSEATGTKKTYRAQLQHISKPIVNFKKTARGVSIVNIPVNARLRVFDASGRQIAIVKDAGELTLSISAQGVYVYSLSNNGIIYNGKINITK